MQQLLNVYWRFNLVPIHAVSQPGWFAPTTTYGTPHPKVDPSQGASRQHRHTGFEGAMPKRSLLHTLWQYWQGPVSHSPVEHKAGALPVCIAMLHCCMMCTAGRKAHSCVVLEVPHSDIASLQLHIASKVICSTLPRAGRHMVMRPAHHMHILLACTVMNHFALAVLGAGQSVQGESKGRL